MSNRQISLARGLRHKIQLSFGYASLTTTERYLGVHQDLHDAPCDYIKLDLAAAE